MPPEKSRARAAGGADVARGVRLRWKLAILTGILLGLLAAAEVYLRQRGLYEPPGYPPVCERPEFYQFHEPYGYRVYPSRTRTYPYPPENPRELTVVTNRHGFRSKREIDEPDPRPRLVVLGDSFVFGDGVEHEERFSDRLQAMQPDWRVDNLGMTGFGPDLMLMAFEEVALPVGPDVVVLCVYTDDFRRVQPHFNGVGYEIPRLAVRGGELTRIAYPRPHLLSPLHVYQMARRAWWKLSRAEWKLVEAILQRFVELGGSHDFRTVLVFLPGWDDTPGDRERRFFLRDFAAVANLPFLDLTEAIHRRKGKSFIKNNWHYSPYGNEVVAEELHAFLLGEGIVGE